jgi:hypothetical protein
VTATLISAAAWPAVVDRVGEGAGSGGHRSEEQVEVADEFGVALFGGPVAFGGVLADEVLDPVDDLSLVAGVHLIEGAGHAHRVTPTSLPEIFSGVWSGLTPDHRLLFQVATTLGCLFFLIVGAVLR